MCLTTKPFINTKKVKKLINQTKSRIYFKVIESGKRRIGRRGNQRKSLESDCYRKVACRR